MAHSFHRRRALALAAPTIVLWGAAGAALLPRAADAAASKATTANKATVAKKPAAAPVSIAARGPAVARIELAPPAKSKLLSGDSVPLQATAFDAADNVLGAARVSYRITPRTAGRIVRGAFVAGRAGTATIVAVNGKVLSNEIQILVNEVGRIDVTPGGPFERHLGDTLVFRAQAFDVAGVPLPNEEYPNVPLVWRSSGGGPITPGGALALRRAGRASVFAVSGRAKSNVVSITVRRRQESASTRIFFTGQPVAGATSVAVTIERLEVISEADLQAGNGNWRTVLTGDEIDALVGQPIDFQRLNNLRAQVGTAYLPEGEYRRARITFSTAPGANRVTRIDGTPIDLTWDAPEDAVLELPIYLFVIKGFPMNAVFELLLPRSIVLGEDESTLFFEPFLEFTPMDDDELKLPFGSVVGQMPARDDIVLVFASTPDTGWNDLRNYFGSYDAQTGAFRISSMPAGVYNLGVTFRGRPDPVMLGTFRIVPGRDNVLPGTIPLP